MVTKSGWLGWVTALVMAVSIARSAAPLTRWGLNFVRQKSTDPAASSLFLHNVSVRSRVIPIRTPAATSRVSFHLSRRKLWL
jgi:hypothetical protein